jgi:hypothetical protein
MSSTILTIGDFGFTTGSDTPSAYRLVRHNGELTLQGCFTWRSEKGMDFEWRDIPTVTEDLEHAEAEE